ncbi:MAG: DUF6512 family protein, partial [Clostridia bacterium]|nr:DUF6512 family protein [Clostridia bacterium]
RFFTAKAAAAAVLVLSYAALWYTLTGIAGRGLTAADTAIAQAAGAALLTALAFLLSFRLIVRGGGHAVAFVSAVAALAAMTAMFCCFTLLPPEVDLFRDPLSGRYGLDSGPINEIAGALFAGPAAPQTCINAKRV